MSETFLTSDQHFGHENIIKYCNRPFTSVEEMDESMITNFNSVVSKNDLTYHGGDFSLRFEFVEKYLPRLNGRHILICGNHDACWPERNKAGQFLLSYLKAGFEEVLIYKKLEVGEQSFWLAHQPPIIENDPKEKGKYRFPDLKKSEWLLHGHVHDHWKVKGNLINVGVDVWDFRPVNIKQIIEIIKNGTTNNE